MTTPPLNAFLQGHFSAGGPPVTRHVYQPAAAFVAYAAASLGLHPNLITLVGGFVSIAACLLLGQGFEKPLFAAGVACLLALGYIFDCADGQVARATKKTSALGGWLDLAVDLGVNIALGASLTMYSWQVGNGVAISLLLGAILGYSRSLSLLSSAVKRRGGGITEEARGVRLLVRSTLDSGAFVIAYGISSMLASCLFVVSIFYSIGYFLHAISLGRRSW